MPLDQTANFVRVNIQGTYTSSDTTIQLASGEASEVPDPANGEYNLVWFDSKNSDSPSSDPEAEIVRVTGKDTNNDTITVQRGQEDTSAVAHDTSDAVYQLILSPTSKLINDVDAANFETNTLSVAGNSVALGDSTAVNHSDLSNIGTGDHHTRYSDEEAQDAVGGILNADFSYDDAGNSIALASNSLTVAGNTAALGGSTAVQYIDLNDTGSSFPIPNNDLSNSSLTVANTSIGLGGSGTPEVDNFNGNNGTAGQFLQTDGTNLIFTDLTVREIQQLINNQAVIRDNLAKNNFEDNLDELAYQGGFYDIFADDSKIQSSSNVTISTLADGDNDGKVTLTPNISKDVDGFEDGDYTNDPFWSEITGGADATVQTGTVKNGSYALETSDATTLRYDRGTNREDMDSITSWTCFLRDDGSGERFFYTITNNENAFDDDSVSIGFTTVGRIQLRVNDAGGFPETTTLVDLYNHNEWYKVEIIFDSSDGSVQAKIFDSSDTEVGSASSTNWSGNNLRYVSLNRQSFDTGVKAYFDDATYEARQFYPSDRYIVEREDLSSGDDDFTNPPVAITVNQDADIPADEDIQYIVKDVNGSGDEETITQSEVGTSVDISDFTGFLVEVKTEYSTSDGNDTPTHRSQDFYFEEG